MVDLGWQGSGEAREHQRHQVKLFLYTDIHILLGNPGGITRGPREREYLSYPTSEESVGDSSKVNQAELTFVR